MTTNNTNGQEIVTLQEIDVHNVWKNEATNFTPWLAEKISLLSATLNMDLDVIEIEKSVGPFYADIYAEDRDGNAVIIENQLEKTDHKHLGQIITYAAGLKGKTMVWITPEVRPEHAAAVNWLNAINTNVQFYLIEITTNRIGKEEDATVAVNFRIVCEPNDMTDSMKGNHESESIKKEKYIKFWSQVKDIDTHIDKLLKNRPAKHYRYMSVRNNFGGDWDYYVLANNIRAELYTTDKDLYNSILIHRNDIEAEFGEPLIWINDKDRKASKIVSKSDIGGINNEDKWDEIQYDLVDRMSRLKSAIEKYL